jgi:hypothetical protein
MDDRDRLAFYPFVVVRIACRGCSRNGAYRLARLAAKFGPEIGLRDLLNRASTTIGCNNASPTPQFWQLNSIKGRGNPPVSNACATSYGKIGASSKVSSGKWDSFIGWPRK